MIKIKVVSMLGSIIIEKPFDIDEVLIKLLNAEPLLEWAKIKLPPNNNITIYKSRKFSIYEAISKKELVEKNN